jgi:hypothetical protein
MGGFLAYIIVHVPCTYNQSIIPEPHMLSILAIQIRILHFAYQNSQDLFTSLGIYLISDS